MNTPDLLILSDVHTIVFPIVQYAFERSTEKPLYTNEREFTATGLDCLF